MRKTSSLVLSLMMAALILTCINSAPKTGSAISEVGPVPLIYVDPPVIKDPTKGIGSNFTVSINIDNVESLFGWQVNLTFNKEVVNCTSRNQIVQGPFLSDWFGLSYVSFSRSINYEEGYLLIAASKKPPFEPGEIGAMGNGTLAYITFTVIAEERSTYLHLGDLTYLRTVIGDPPTSVAIEPITTSDGYFDNRTTSTPPVANFSIVTPFPEVGVPVDFSANGSYDPDGWLDNFYWDYGDNQSQIYVRGVNLTTWTTHVYMHAGMYLVALTVTDNDGLNASTYALANVTERFVIARVAVLDSWSVPSYFTGGWGNDYQPLVDALNFEGFYAQAVTNEEIMGGILSSFDVFVMVDNAPNVAAVPHVVAFWSNGGGAIAFDSSICFLNYAGILPPESAGSNGAGIYWDYSTAYQAKISASHPITAGYEVGQIINGASGDAEYRVDALAITTAYPYYAMLVGDVTRPDRAYVSAYEPPSSGKVVHIWDQSHWRNPYLQSMILNAMAWAIAPQYEHDLAASIVVSPFVRLDYPTMLNATAQNRGLNNETNVELNILVNGDVVDSVLIPELLATSSYTLSYEWTPATESYYNITAQVTPVPEEGDTANNEQTAVVLVVRPLIEPVEGQWANYMITSSYGMSMLLNTTYSHYISPVQLNVSLWMSDLAGHSMSGSLTLNILTRQVEAGLWSGLWYPLWIQTEVANGSAVEILDRIGIVTESRFVEVGDYMVECWGLNVPYYSMFYTFWFDKVNGLVVAADGSTPYNSTEIWRLTSTNVPLAYLPRLGIQIDPENGPVETEVTIIGVNAMPNSTVEIRWDDTYMGTTAVDENGNFTYTFAVPPSTRGVHTITAIDLSTGMDDTEAFTILSTISVTPISGPMGTKVQITGLGFEANEHVVLTFEDMQIAEVNTDDSGSFTATFNIPLALNGHYQVKAWYGDDYAEATFTVTEMLKLDLTIDVGAIYFKGETAEIYIQTAFNGKPIDVTTMNAQLYMPDGTTTTLTYKRIAPGLYKITYLLNGKGSMMGTYTTVIEANYATDTIAAYGTTLRTFLVKSTWEKEVPRVAAFSLASIGLISAMVVLWRKEKKRYL